MYRRKDPQTSIDGAAHVRPKLTGYEAEFVRVLVAYPMSLTCWEIAMIAYPDQRIQQDSIRKRASGLERKGWIRCSGERRCTVSGRVARVYEVVR